MVLNISHSNRLSNHGLPGAKKLADTFFHRGHVACHEIVELALNNLTLPKLTLHELVLHRLSVLELFIRGSSLLWLLLYRFAELDSTSPLLLLVVQPLHLALAHDIEQSVPEASLYVLEALALLCKEDKPLGQHLVAFLAQADFLG